MQRFLKATGFIMLVLVLAVGCNKPDGPNNGGNSNEGNDTVVDNGGSLNGHDYVDLGLPSGTLWATCNIGADTPEDDGDYFAWAETMPKEIYDWKSYKYGGFHEEGYELSKYCTDSSYGLDGFVDNKLFLEPADDVVRVQWGADWRMPTCDEWEELLLNTASEWTTLGGVDGWRFTAQNGNSLFLPAAGYYWETSLNTGLGLYWSSMINKEFPYRTWGIHFNSYQCHICGSSDRNRGQTVRAVRATKSAAQ